MQEQKHDGMTLIIVIYQAQSGAFASPYLADVAHSPNGGSIHMTCANVVLKFTIYIHLSQKRLSYYSTQIQFTYIPATSQKLIRTRAYTEATGTELDHEAEDP